MEFFTEIPALMTDPRVWASFATLAFLEIVLGIDNVIFISIIAEKLPEHQRHRARQLGLLLALGMRLVLLASISWIMGLTDPITTLELFWSDEPYDLTWRNIILLLGGFFLLWKATTEIHHEMEDSPAEEASKGDVAKATFGAVLVQIGLMDLIFSLDSVITAVGMAEHLQVMVFAVIVAIGVMIWAAGPVARFINAHPTAKMLALAFLILIAMTLVAEGLGQHVPKGYIYCAIVFSIAVEALNWRAKQKRLTEVRAEAARRRTLVDPLNPGATYETE
ncbi:MAG: TerC family protein [Alphaproteobacteria bacterium]